MAFSFAADYAFGGTKVEIYHVTNVLIHHFGGIDLVTRLFAARFYAGNYGPTDLPVGDVAGGNRRRRCGSSHPLNTQAVTYIVQRAESLASLFFLASIYCLIRSADGSKWWGVRRGGRVRAGDGQQGNRRGFACCRDSL